MGLSASQSRLMMITARLSDLELKAQTISNSKVRLSDMSAAASEKYTKALDKQLLTVKNPSTTATTATVNANLYNLTTYNAISNMDHQRFVKNSGGQVLISSAVANAFNANGTATTEAQFLTAMGVDMSDAGAVKYYKALWLEVKGDGTAEHKGSGALEISNDKLMSSEWLQAEIDAGNIFLYTQDTQDSSTTKGEFINVSWTSGDTSLAEVHDKTDQAIAEAEYEQTMAAIQSKDKKFDVALKSIDTEHQAAQTELESIQKVIDKNIERSFKIFNG